MKPEAILLTLRYTLVTPQLIRTIHYTNGSVYILCSIHHSYYLQMTVQYMPRPQTLHFEHIFDLARNEMLGGGSGEFYYASEDKCREKVKTSY